MKRSILAILFVAFSVAGFAQARTPHINQRQQRQQHRIRQGVNKGTLTPREAGQLQAQQARIQQNKLHAKSDGKLSMREKSVLNRQQHRAGRAIYRQKHDAQVVR
jgi:protein-disulfide isomerase